MGWLIIDIPVWAQNGSPFHLWGLRPDQEWPDFRCVMQAQGHTGGFWRTQITSTSLTQAQGHEHGGATATGPDATYPPAICQNPGGGGGGGLGGLFGGVGWRV